MTFWRKAPATSVTLVKGILPAPLPRLKGDDLPAMICRPVFQEMSIHANGDIVCSCADPTGMRVYGNVYRDRIADVFNGPMYRAIRKWQLASRPDCWCPVINSNCAGRITRATEIDQPDGRQVKMLQLEPVSFCNLRCPSCPVTTHFPAPENADRRNKMLPLEKMLDIVDQLPGLEILLFYNFGEALLHPDAVPFLRSVKRDRPEIFVANSTNGLAFKNGSLEAIAKEGLLNRIVFAIDGVTPETYARYRVGGNSEKALRNLESFVRACQEAGSRSAVEIIWQYILFEWNDSDQELARAKDIAHAMGVPINWIITHTPGASKRYTSGSNALRELEGRSFCTDTCEVQLQDFIAHNRIAKGRYLARLSTDRRTIRGVAGSKVTLKIRVENLSETVWDLSRPDRYHVGFLLRSETGKKIRELAGGSLPPGTGTPKNPHRIEIDLILPLDAGRYQLLVDVVEANVCWFHERGSAPLICELEVRS